MKSLALFDTVFCFACFTIRCYLERERCANLDSFVLGAVSGGWKSFEALEKASLKKKIIRVPEEHPVENEATCNKHLWLFDRKLVLLYSKLK